MSALAGERLSRLASLIMVARDEAAELGARPARFRDALRNRTFAILYAAETQSTIGDQLARVALSILVFDRTRSAVAAALTFAATFLPAVAGGLLLGRLGDQLPRRTVMVGCDMLRAALFGVMALPGVPTAVLIALLVAAVFVGPAFSAAEVSLLASSLDAETFRAGTGLRMMSTQLAQVAGFALGGALVAALQPRGALGVDAATYVISAMGVAALVRERSAVRRAGAERRGDARAWLAVVRLPEVRRLLALSSLAGLFVVPEGLAVPFCRSVGASSVQAGLLLAAIPLGGALGANLVVRLPAGARRQRMSRAMAVGCGVPLALTPVASHSWAVALCLWFVSGLLAAYQVEVISALVQAFPDAIRSRALGFTSSLLLGAQGVGLVIFGAVAGVVAPTTVVGLAGLLGVALASLLAGRPTSVQRQHEPTHSV
jgi:MFS family permease